MTRSMKAAAAITAALSIGALVAIAAVGDDPEIPNTTISAGQFKDANYYDRWDRVGAGVQEFVITRNGVPTAFVGDLEEPPTTTTTSTTTTPPPTGGYPLISANQAEFTGDFDPDCDRSEWSPIYNEKSRTDVLTGGPFGCFARMTSQGSGGGVRAELGTPHLPAGGEFTDEFLLRVPSGTSHTGYIRQNKLEENAGSCANGGWSMPQDEGGRIMLRVRSDCDADHRDLDFGTPPHDQWFAVWAHCKLANSGGFCHARLDPDGPGSQPYSAVKSVTGDTSSGGNIKLRLGPYGSMPSGDHVDVDEYRRDNA